MFILICYLTTQILHIQHFFNLILLKVNLNLKYLYNISVNIIWKVLQIYHILKKVSYKVYVGGLDNNLDILQ